MTQHEENDNTVNSENGAGYYAVNPQRIQQVFEMFNMRPSHFTAGGQPSAQKIYYDAKKIMEGGTNNRWGHHTIKSIQGFCQFTQLKNDVVLPWQELIEHHGLYDGKEGTGPRTGNQLLTLNRLQFNAQTLVMWREKRSLSQRELANKAGLPSPLITAMENGDWETVAESTARSITGVLNIEQQTLFSPLTEDVAANADIPVPDGVMIPRTSIAGKKRLIQKVLIMTSALLLLIIISYVFYPGDHQQVVRPNLELHDRSAKNSIIDSQWHARIVPISDRIPVEPDAKTMWGKGAYLHLRKDGKLGFNWSTPNGYNYDPSHSWQQKAHMLTIDLGIISYSFDLNQDDDILTTFNNEGGIYKMTLKKM